MRRSAGVFVVAVVGTLTTMPLAEEDGHGGGDDLLVSFLLDLIE